MTADTAKNVAEVGALNFDSQHAEFLAERGDIGGDWDQGLRAAALEDFASQGLPSTRLEEWRYTNISYVGDDSYRFRLNGASVVATADAATLRFGDVDAYRVVIVNGVYSSSHSCVADAPGVTVCSLGSEIKSASPEIQTHLGGCADTKSDAFSALNTAFLHDGCYIRVSQNQFLDKPIHIVHVTTEAQSHAIYHPRCLVVMEDGSCATVIESYVGMAKTPYLNNCVAEITLGCNATVDHVKLQEEAPDGSHIASLWVRQQRDSRFRSYVVSAGGRLARTAIRVTLADEGASCVLDGVYLGSGKQHVDVSTLIDHQAPNCTSREFYKGVLDERASSIFNGYVHVAQDAQKTDSSQQNRNLLLSKNATANTRPQLEIYADDVKCAHGATVSQLEEEQVFYLRSRGISEAEAKRELMVAFASDVLNGIPNEEIRSELTGRVRDALNSFHAA